MVMRWTTKRVLDPRGASRSLVRRAVGAQRGDTVAHLHAPQHLLVAHVGEADRRGITVAPDPNSHALTVDLGEHLAQVPLAGIDAEPGAGLPWTNEKIEIGEDQLPRQYFPNG